MKNLKGLFSRLWYSAVSVTYPVLMIYSYFVFVGKYCIQSQSFEDAKILIYFLIFHMILIFNLIFYMRILAIDDTSTANRFKGKGINTKIIQKNYFNPFIYQEIESKKKNMLKKCNFCMTYKPPRTHHCSVCNKCFLKYDHHCKYLGVCIAFYNYKFFYLFLISNIIYCIYVVTLLMINLLNTKDLVANLITQFIVCISLLTVEFLLSLKKLIIHTILISRNETTIESQALDAFFEGDQGLIYIFQEGAITMREDVLDRPQMNPYDLGIIKNWNQIFGDRKTTWLLPISTTKGDGINFPKR